MVFSVVNRWQAFGIHLAISLLIFIALAALIYRWYPGILFQYDGGLEGIQLIAGVDLVIGPLLTLVVFNRAKKSLKTDLAIIALLQAACLTGGMWTVYQTRPVAVVYSEGAFRSITDQVYRGVGIDISEISRLAKPWPVWVAVSADAPKAPNGKKGLQNMAGFFETTFYRSYQDYLVEIGKYGKKAEHIANFPAGSLKGAVQQAGAVWYFPAALSSGAGFIGINMDTGEAVDFAMDLNREKYLRDYWRNIKDYWQKYTGN